MLDGLVNETSVPVAVSWTTAPKVGSMVSRYTLQRRAASGSWLGVPLSTALARSVVIRLKPWETHQFRLRATYANGQITDWATSVEPLWLAYADEVDLAATYSAGWNTFTQAKSHRGMRRAATAAGSSVSFKFNGTHVAWISRYGPDRGRARVYVDDSLVATVDLRRSRIRHRRAAFRASWPTATERTLRIEVEGTAGRPTVDVDAFVTFGPTRAETIVGAGDIGRCGVEGPELTAQVIEGVEGIVYTTGDNAYPGGTAAEFAECYDPTWGRFRTRTRPSPGNHDYQVAGAKPYYDYFGALAGPAGQGWFSYEAGTWRVYSLSSEICGSASGFCSPGSAQYDWLRRELLNNPHACTLAYWHRPRFSSGYHGSSRRMANLTQLLYDNGTELILAGHDHSYEQLERVDPAGTPDSARGIRHFTIGTGGAALFAFTKDPLPVTVTRQADVHGVLRLDLRHGSYDWQYLPTSGEYTDSGSDACH
jgi:hypothetical protein